MFEAHKGVSLPQTLLHELKAAGHITPLTTWKSLYPLVESSPAYDNLLGVPGSSPIDLFWDVLDEVERQADNEQVSFEKIMEENNLGVQDDDTYNTFVERLERHERLAKFDYFTTKTVFDRVSVLRSFHRYIEPKTKFILLFSTSASCASVEDQKGGKA